MRYLTLILLLFSGALIGQTTQDSLLQQLRAVVVVNSSVNVDTNEYNIVVTQFQDPTTLYGVLDVDPGDWLWTLSSVPGEVCNRYQIVSITNTGVGEYTINALNPDKTGINGMPQAGVGNPIYRHSPNQDYPLFISSQPTLSGYINPNIQTCVTTHLILAIDKDIKAIGDSAVISSLTDNGDGTYTHDDGNGNTVIVDTRADTNPVTDPGGYYGGDNVEDVLQEVPNLDCSIINQTSHGLSVGQMATFTTQYELAMTDTALHLPVGIVTEVFNANSFRLCYTGKLRGAHGLTIDRDYFLQDDGSFDTIPDPELPVFAFRTVGGNERVFDVPEYISNGNSGGGSSGAYTFVNNETGGNAPGAPTEPTNPPAGATNGSIVIESYDDSILYWSYNGSSWTLEYTQPLGSSPTELNGIYTPTNADSIVNDLYTIRLADRISFISDSDSSASTSPRIGLNMTPSLSQVLQISGKMTVRDTSDGITTTPASSISIQNSTQTHHLYDPFGAFQNTMSSGNYLHNAIGRNSQLAAKIGYQYEQTDGSYGFAAIQNGGNLSDIRRVITWDFQDNVEIGGDTRDFGGATATTTSGVLRINPVKNEPTTTLSSGSLLYHHNGDLFQWDSLGRKVNLTGPQYSFASITGAVSNSISSTDTVRFNAGTTGAINNYNTTAGLTVEADGSVTWNGGYDAPLEIEITTQIISGTGTQDIDMWVAKNGNIIPASNAIKSVTTVNENLGVVRIIDNASSGDSYTLYISPSAATTTYTASSYNISAKVVK